MKILNNVDEEKIGILNGMGREKELQIIDLNMIQLESKRFSTPLSWTYRGLYHFHGN